MYEKSLFETLSGGESNIIKGRASFVHAPNFEVFSESVPDAQLLIARFTPFCFSFLLAHLDKAAEKAGRIVYARISVSACANDVALNLLYFCNVMAGYREPRTCKSYVRLVSGLERTHPLLMNLINASRADCTRKVATDRQKIFAKGKDVIFIFCIALHLNLNRCKGPTL